MTDLQGKYQKLTAEYAKLKAHIPVLRKAFVDEQTAHNALKEAVKEKDQCIRKFEQEVDSLTFRNQQLSKRVIFLQEELDQAESSKKKSKHKDLPTAPHPPTSPTIFNEELMSKIDENVRLHKQVHENEMTSQAQIQELKEKLSRFEQDHTQHEQVLQSFQQKSKAQIDKLQEEKAMLEVKLQSLDSEVRNYRSRAELAEENLQAVHQDLKAQLNAANKLIADKLPFIDTKHRDINGLNLPTHDRRHQLRSRELVSQATNLLAELIQGLSNFYTYTEQRSKIYPCDGKAEPISPVNEKFCKFLHENVLYLRPVEQSLRSFLESLKEDSLTTLETATGLQPFSRNFSAMVAYMNKLLPYQLLSIKEECEVSSCTSTLQTKNLELHASLKKLTSVFNKLDSHICILAAQSSPSCCHPAVNHPRLFSMLSVSVRDLTDAVKEVSKHYNSKVSLEHQLPTATQKLKTTDECVVSSLISLVTCTGKFSAFLLGNLDFFSQLAGYRTRGSSISNDSIPDGPRSNPAVVQFRQKAASYMKTLSRSCPESVPYKVAAQNRKILLSSAESKEGLAKQISGFQQRVSKLEQEKEHWLLEAQLLKIKYENECQKAKKLERDLECQSQNSNVNSIEANMIRDAPKTPRKDTGSNMILDSTMLGKQELLSGSSDSSSREDLIKKHFNDRINELTLQQQMADSKAVNFHAEVRALHKQLKSAQKTKTYAEDELKCMSQTLAQLKDELQTTTRSYEGQLSMMSEHLAGMNDKLAKQKDEIDDLKSQLSQSKASKKTRK
ncbi:hypothetical protein ACJMK2_037149 [Sinanodonta woodiana]|uniref:Protein phosphatase 1 regulatory subunit 21 n=1 Tax=Sinanodonta woodiana TaxID=1069815 RepID=A0ABD3WJD7_SINWO